VVQDPQWLVSVLSSASQPLLALPSQFSNLKTKSTYGRVTITRHRKVVWQVTTASTARQQVQCEWVWVRFSSAWLLVGIAIRFILH
jgi:hypothetical protein